MIVVALCGFAVGCGGGGGGPHFDQSMIVASKTSGVNTTEQTRVIALGPGLNESDAKKVAGECATQLGKNRGNGATCSLYASRGALDSASYNELDATVKRECWTAKATYLPAKPLETTSVTQEALVREGCKP
jgi:hypothetical protein